MNDELFDQMREEWKADPKKLFAYLAEYHKQQASRTGASDEECKKDSSRSAYYELLRRHQAITEERDRLKQDPKSMSLRQMVEKIREESDVTASMLEDLHQYIQTYLSN